VEFQASGERIPLVDLWHEPNALRTHVDLLVAPELAPSIRTLIAESGILSVKVEVMSEDIQHHIDRERVKWRGVRGRRATTTNPTQPGHSNRSSTFFDLNRYHRYTAIVDYLQALAHENPNLVRVVELGRSFEGRRMVGIKVGFPEKNASSDTGYKPSVFVDGGMHAREWIAPATALYLVDRVSGECRHGLPRLFLKVRDF